MKTFKVWQPGFESEAIEKTVEDDECPACAMGGPPEYMPDGESVVAAFQEVGQHVQRYRLMTCINLIFKGWMCREANAEEVEQAKQMAIDIQNGAVDLRAEWESKLS